MEAGNQQQGDQKEMANDTTLDAQLTDFAQKVFLVRHEEAKWQAILQSAPTNIITYLSNNPALMSDILRAENEDALKDALHEHLASSEENAKDAASSEQSEVASSTGTETGSSESSGSPTAQQTEDEQTNVDPAVSAEVSGSSSGASESPAPQQAENNQANIESEAIAEVSDSDSSGTPETLAPAQAEDEQTNIDPAVSAEANDASSADMPVAPASQDQSDDTVSSDEALVDFLKKVFAAKDQNDQLSNVLENANTNILNRLDQNPFYISEVIQMTNENAFNDFISQLQATKGPIELTNAISNEAINDDVVGELRNNWAYINFDCQITNPQNAEVLDSGVEKEAITWMSNAGVPVVCSPSSDGKVITVALSMHGMMDGYDASTDARGEIDDTEKQYAFSDAAPATRKMIAAYDLAEFVKSLEMDGVKIRSGHRSLLRNFWAICKVNNIACAGFEPKPSELTWYQKRESVLQDKFTLDQSLEHTQAHGLSMSSGGGATAQLTQGDSGPAGQKADDGTVSTQDSAESLDNTALSTGSERANVESSGERQAESQQKAQSSEAPSKAVAQKSQNKSAGKRSEGGKKKDVSDAGKDKKVNQGTRKKQADRQNGQKKVGTEKPAKAKAVKNAKGEGGKKDADA